MQLTVAKDNFHIENTDAAYLPIRKLNSTFHDHLGKQIIYINVCGKWTQKGCAYGKSNFIFNVSEC